MAFDAQGLAHLLNHHDKFETENQHVRPAVSVCMAAYNGERYIEAQIRSILPQLGCADEIVIVDDASKDGTLKKVRLIQDELKDERSAPRLKLIEQSQNMGVVVTFEAALRSATGDILFLCDDDDLWAPNKVDRVLEAFADHPSAQIVATGLSLIDEFDQPLQEQGLLKHRRFTSNLLANLMHNQFQGSAMAIRASLLGAVLPFPKGKIFLHDAWIGTRNQVAGGSAVYIDEPLLLYRRHTGNYSRTLSRIKQVKLRLQLVGALLLRATSIR